MTKAQRVMLFKLFHRACKATGVKSDDETRHRMTEEALGHAKSWTKLHNGDVDKLKNYLLMTVDPENIKWINPFLHPETEERKRLLVSIASMAEDLGDAYLHKICSDKTRNRSGDYRSLDDPQLRQFFYTIKDRHRAWKARRKPEPAIDDNCPF